MWSDILNDYYAKIGVRRKVRFQTAEIQLRIFLRIKEIGDVFSNARNNNE